MFAEYIIQIIASIVAAHRISPPEDTRTLWIHPKLLDTLRQVAFKRIVGAFNDAELETILHIPCGGSRDWLLRTSDEFFR